MTAKEEILMFCANVKLLRERNGLSKNEMEKICKIEVSSLEQMEQGIIPSEIPIDII